MTAPEERRDREDRTIRTLSWVCVVLGAMAIPALASMAVTILLPVVSPPRARFGQPTSIVVMDLVLGASVMVIVFGALLTAVGLKRKSPRLLALGLAALCLGASTYCVVAGLGRLWLLRVLPPRTLRDVRLAFSLAHELGGTFACAAISGYTWRSLRRLARLASGAAERPTEDML